MTRSCFVGLKWLFLHVHYTYIYKNVHYTYMYTGLVSSPPIHLKSDCVHTAINCKPESRSTKFKSICPPMNTRIPWTFKNCFHAFCIISLFSISNDNAYLISTIINILILLSIDYRHTRMNHQLIFFSFKKQDRIIFPQWLV